MNPIDQLKQNVKSHKPLAVVALGGDERALIDEALALLRNKFAGENQLNYHRFATGDDDLEQLISTLNTMPFLAPTRMVEVHSAEKLPKPLIKEVIDYANDPFSHSMLVLVFGKIDKRSKLISSLSSLGYLYLFESMKEKEQVGYIMQMAGDLDIKITASAAQFLVIILDGDLLSIKEVLNKLSLRAQDREISIGDIEQVTIAGGGADVFALARRISEGDVSQALIDLWRLRNSRENAIKFLGVLTWQFRTLLHIRHHLDQRMSDWDIRKTVGVYGDRYDWMAKIARKKDIKFHISRLTNLLDCDQSLKSLNICDPFTLIEKIIYQSAVGIRRA